MNGKGCKTKSKGRIMYRRTGKKRLPLKTVYYLSFVFFIVIPILIVLIAALLIMNQQFKKQAVENIKRAQETIITELSSDIDIMSMRLSHLIYANNNEVLQYAAATNTADGIRRYEYEQRLAQAGNLALEPVKDVISVGFYMKDGEKTYIKNEIHRSTEEIKKTAWYQKALETKNTVCVGSYDTAAMNDLFTGGKKDLLILVFALAPDVKTDRSQKIEMVTFYQSTDAADRIRMNNLNYLDGKNNLGITQVTNEAGELIFSTQDTEFTGDLSEYTLIRSPLRLHDTVWYIENYIRTPELMKEYWNLAIGILAAAVVILSLAGYYSRYFLRSIVRPIEEISTGLRQVEEGNLEVHITPNGQFEIRNMIHLFNAMVRRLKALIHEYEEKVRSAEKSPQDYLAVLLSGSMTPQEVAHSAQDFFAEPYALLGIHIMYQNRGETALELSDKLAYSFERNPLFVARCMLYQESPSFFYVFYRIMEEDYAGKVRSMARELQRAAEKEFEVQLAVCIGTKRAGSSEWEGQAEQIKSKMCYRHLMGANAVIDLNEEAHREADLLELAGAYEKLANALCTADEKNIMLEKEKLFESFHNAADRIALENCTLAAVLAIARRFERDNIYFRDVFGKQYNYLDKISRIEDIRSLKLWLTNYFAWIMDYSASKLNISETDVMIKAKRYIADYYEDADLSLAKVAAYVGLSEKYFTNRFSKETGETFSSYLTAFRIQKAKELLKTTNFKVYEVAEMSGYHNVEHFNRVFKKLTGSTPAQYRKNF